MKMLEVEFQTNADKTGLQTFKQLKRDGRVCLYRREKPDGSIFGYEVIVVKLTKAGTTFPNGVVVPEDTESYGGAHSFGRSAYFCSTLQRAEERFKEFVANIGRVVK